MLDSKPKEPKTKDLTVKTLLCYGDSNTWGYNPATGERLDRHARWPGVLQEALGHGYLVIEEGLNGRTTVWDDPIEGYDKNGKSYLLPCLKTHHPLDLVILLLGTNDLKARFSLPACDIAAGAGALVDVVQKSDTGYHGLPPQVLLVAPPPVAALTGFAEMFTGAQPKSELWAPRYRQVAQECGCPFLDAGQVIVSSPLDGIHWEREEHRKLGLAVADKVKAILEIH